MGPSNHDSSTSPLPQGACAALVDIEGEARRGDFFRLIVEHGAGQGLRHFLLHDEHRRASWV